MPTLQDVPQQIKNMFGSVQTTQKIRRISHRAGLETPNAIPRLLYLLEIKELSVHDFLEALRERLGVGERKAKAIAKTLKENILEFERASLYAWGVDITEIDTHDAPELEEFAQDAIVEEEEIEAELEPQKKESVSVIPVIVEKAPVKGRGEEKKQTIKINPALLRMQADRSETTNEPTREQKNRKTEKQGEDDKPFVLFEQKGVEALRQAPAFAKASAGKQGRRFSMPFGFFKGNASTSASVSRAGESVRAEVKSAGEAPASQKPRVVHYSGERTQVTPFAQEEELFEVQDSRLKTQGLGQRTSLKVEEPAKSGEVQIKKNPFSFPRLQQNAKSDGKPKVEGNVISLK